MNASFLTYIPNEDYFGLDSLSYNVYDGDLYSDEAYIIYEIQGINDPPELPEFFNASIDEDTQYEIEIPMYDVDGDSLDYIINLSNDDDATYDVLDNNLIIYPGLNYNGNIYVTISVSDGIYSDSGLFILEVFPINDAPEIISTPNESIGVGELFEYAIEVYDPDNDEFIFEISDFPEGMALENNIISWTPNTTGLFGPISIIVTDIDSDNPLAASQIFYIDVRLAQNFTLHSGNNLISYLGILQDNSIQNMLLPLSDNISQIITENYASIQLEDGTWIGSIDSIETTKGYWLRINEGTDYNIATYQTPQNQLYLLHEGWNLISYVGNDNADLDIALPNDVEMLFTDIMSENVSAVRNDEGEWVGSLANIGWQHLKGYWVKVLDDISFSFDYEENLPRFANNQLPDYYVTNHPNGFAYNQSQQQTFYYFKDIVLNNEPISNGDWIIAYYNDIIVGSRQWFGAYTDVPTMGYDGFSETSAYCEPNSSIEFKVYKQSTGELINMVGDIPKWNNQNNFIIEKLTQELVLPDNYSLSSPYPNPFNPITNLSFSVPIESHIKITIYDIQGRLVQEILNNLMEPGIHNIKWAANNYASGIYFVNMISGDFSATQKITLLK